MQTTMFNLRGEDGVFQDGDRGEYFRVADHMMDNTLLLARTEFYLSNLIESKSTISN